MDKNFGRNKETLPESFRHWQKAHFQTFVTKPNDLGWQQ